MRSFALIALFSFSAQVHAEEPAVTDMNDELADKLVEKLANKLVEKASLDSTTLGKPGNLQSSLSTKKTSCSKGFACSTFYAGL
jgi:hypothetical protein